MSKNNLKLAILLVILMAFAYAYRGPLKDFRDNLGKPRNFLKKVNIEQLDKIEITKGEETVSLEKYDSKWKVGGTKDFYTDDSSAGNLIESLKEAAEISRLELASDNEDNRDNFQIGSEGIGVKLYSGGNMLSDFIIGKLATDYTSTYVSQAGNPEIYSIGVNLYTPFSQNEWRDDTIFNIEKDKISKLRFQYPNREFTVEKQDGKWQGTLPYSFLVSGEKLDPILDIMSKLYAQDIPEQKFEGTDLEKHLIIVEAVGEGIDNTLMIGKVVASETTGEKLYYAKRGDSDNIYLVSQEVRDELNKYIWQLQ